MYRSICALSLCLIAPLPPNVVAGDWPVYGGDPQHGADSVSSLSDDLTRSWSYTLQSAPDPAWPTRTRQQFDRAYQPVIAHGRLFFGSSADNKVHALDAHTGKRLWEFATGGPIRFAPACWQDRVIVASDDGFVYCLAAHDGALRWSRRAGPRHDMVLGNGRLISRWPVRGGPTV